MEIDHHGLLPPGQLLIIPNRLGETSSRSKLLPDSEVTFSPSTVDFDIKSFVEEAGGYLATHSQYLATTGITSGADVIGALRSSIRLTPGCCWHFGISIGLGLWFPRGSTVD